MVIAGIESNPPDPVYRNVAVHLTRMATVHPDQAAIHFPIGMDPRGSLQYSCITWKQLETDSNRIARGLLAYGMPRGSRTALMVTPSPEFFALTFALLKSGIIPIMVDPGMGAANLKKCFAEAEPHGFIGIPKAHIARILLGWSRKTIRKTVTVFAKGFTWGASLQKIREMGTDEPFYRPLETGFLETMKADEQAAINFTSGSTGIPKGVVYTHDIFAAQIELIRRTYRIEPGEIDLCTFPLFALFAPALGMTAVIPAMDFTRPARVNPENIIQVMNEFSPTNMFGSPALLNTVGRYCAPRNITFPSLRRVICAGAPINPSILRFFTPTLSENSPVYSGYGATEAMPLASIDSHVILTETSQGTDSGKGVCIGTANEGIDLTIIPITDDPVDTWSNDMVLKQGEIGEITARGAVVTQAYFNRDDETRQAKIFDPETGRYRHRMGDLGYVDELGRLWFCGRKSHRVRTTQGDMFTLPVEGIFNAHPDVYRTALVGIGKPGSELPVLCVELEPMRTLGRSKGNGIEKKDRSQRIIQELRGMALRYPHTLSINRFIIHPSFPVDIRHNSKIFREKLRKWVAGRSAKIVLIDQEEISG